MKTNNRLVLPLIVVLLVIFLPFGVIGLGNKIYQAIKGENPEHLHKIDNTLYFYENNKLLGKYTCKHENCDEAKAIIDDVNFDYFQSDNDLLGVFGDGYIFIQEDDKIVLYNLNSNIEIANFNAYKNYGTLISDTFIILQDVYKRFGLFDINNVMFKVEAKYDYIGVSKEMINSSAENLRLLAKENDEYKIIDSEGEIISSSFKSPIYSYDNSYVYILKDNLYHIYSYNNEELLKTIKISRYEAYDEYFIITNNNGDISIYPKDLNETVLKTFKNNGKNISYSIEDNTLTIKDNNDTTIDTYNFNQESEENDE